MIKVTATLALLLIVAGLGGRWYYNRTQVQLAQLAEDNIRLEIAAVSNKETVDRLIEDSRMSEVAATEMQQRLKAAEVYQDELLQKIRTHNLTNLTLEKPELIEKRVNDATAKLFDDLEDITNQ